MVFSKLKTLAIATALFSVIGFANAAPVPVPLGTLNDSLTHSNNAISGAFDDVLYFKADTLLSASGHIVGVDVFGDITGSYAFGVGDSYANANWFASNPIPTSIDSIFSASNDFPSLESGKTYWLEISGEMTYGSYTASVIPAFVPEPGSLALVLAGVGAIVSVSRRRKVTINQLGA